MEFLTFNNLPLPAFNILVLVAADEERRRPSGILIRERFLILAALQLITGALIGVEEQARAVRVLAETGSLVAGFGLIQMRHQQQNAKDARENGGRQQRAAPIQHSGFA